MTTRLPDSSTALALVRLLAPVVTVFMRALMRVLNRTSTRVLARALMRTLMRVSMKVLTPAQGLGQHSVDHNAHELIVHTLQKINLKTTNVHDCVLSAQEKPE